MQESAILKGGESIAADPEDRKGKDWTRVEVAGRGNRGKKRKWRRIESSPLSFSRAPIRVVCLPRGCRQLVEDVAASYRGPRKGPFCRDFSDWWWRFNGAASTLVRSSVMRADGSTAWFWIIGWNRLNWLRSILTTWKAPRLPFQWCIASCSRR